MNMDLENITPRRRNLKELRKGARLEKVPCGSKKNQSMRKFDIIPLHKQLNNDEVQQEIIHDFNSRLAAARSSTPEQPRSKRMLRYEEPLPTKRPRPNPATALIDGDEDPVYLPETEPPVGKPKKARVACTFPGCESTFSQRSSMTRQLPTQTGWVCMAEPYPALAYYLLFCPLLPFYKIVSE